MSDDERRARNLGRRHGRAAVLGLPARDRLQHRFDTPGKHFTWKGLERDLDRLSDLNVARVDLRDLRAKDRI
jgi:hypothetical protein